MGLVDKQTSSLIQILATAFKNKNEFNIPTYENSKNYSIRNFE